MSLSVDLEKRLGSFHLRVQFQAEDEITALLGASGCGKSMTLKCIAGIVTPDRGRIVLNDRVLFDSEAGIDLPPQQRRVGYLFQNYALFPNMTVEKNILCGIRSGSKVEKAAALAEALHRFRLEGLEHHYPAQLSGGQQQRVALARILCTRPEAILLDEPFSALDSFLKWKLELELSDLLADFHGPILWVSHDRGEVFRNCKKVCVMEQGQSQGMFSLRQLFHEPENGSRRPAFRVQEHCGGRSGRKRGDAAPVGTDAGLRESGAGGRPLGRHPRPPCDGGAGGDGGGFPLRRGAGDSGCVHHHRPAAAGTRRPGCSTFADGAGTGGLVCAEPAGPALDRRPAAGHFAAEVRKAALASRQSVSNCPRHPGNREPCL